MANVQEGSGSVINRTPVCLLHFSGLRICGSGIFVDPEEIFTDPERSKNEIPTLSGVHSLASPSF